MKLRFRRKITLGNLAILLLILLFVSGWRFHGTPVYPPNGEFASIQEKITITPPDPTRRVVPGTIDATAPQTGTVSAVIDGDTIRLESGETIRYIGIDTPESTREQECYGTEAARANRDLVLGKTVRLERDMSETDRFGRLLRYVYVEDTLVNERLVRDGFAESTAYRPDTAKQQVFDTAEQEAQSAQRGLWAACTGTVPPQQPEAGPNGCTIKGNVSGAGNKIFHEPGCRDYPRVTIDEAAGEQWFCTQDEAVAAGWRRAQNCN